MDRKIWLSLFLSVMISGANIGTAYGQLTLINQVKPSSAQVSDFTRYGKYNPQLYTGCVSVSLPVYEYRDRDFVLPVTLDYRYNGLIANNQASETGLGWTLHCGGYIVREVKGVPDEEVGSIVSFSGGSILSETLYGFDAIPFSNLGSTVLVPYYEPVYNQHSPNDMIKVFYRYDGKAYDASCDVYHFSFLGHTGSFVRKSDGKFVVYNTSGGSGEYYVQKENRSMGDGTGSVTSQIIITTADGYKYYFGSLEDYQFLTTDRSVPDSKTPETERQSILSWKLVKITAPSGREVFFTYGTSHGTGNARVSNYRPSLWYYYSDSGSSSNNINTEGGETSSCPLDAVTVEGRDIVSFDYTEKQAALTGKYINGTSGLANLPLNKVNMLLTKIVHGNTSTHLSYTYNQNGNPYPFLKRVHTDGTGSYEMDYLNLSGGYFPPHGTTATDHWGYSNSTTESICNSNSISTSSLSIISNNVETLNPRKNPNYNASSLGLLTKITYPSKGYTRFTYQENDYSQKVAKEAPDGFKLSLYNATGSGPGARIKRISNWDKNGVALDSVVYNYRNELGQSSGILLKSPRYQVAYAGTLQGYTVYVHYATTGGLVSYDAVPVEYSRVEEVLSDGSKNVYHFSNWLTTPDQSVRDYQSMIRVISTGWNYIAGPLSVTNRDIINNILVPGVSRQAERGKLVTREVYAAGSSSVLEKETNTYTDAALNGINEYVNVGDAFATVPRYTGDPLLSCSLKQTYYGSGSVDGSINYTFNSLGQKIQEEKTESNGDVYRSVYLYIPDKSSGERTAVENAMYNANVTGYPLQVTLQVKKAGTTTWSILNEDKYTFGEYTNALGGKFYRVWKWEKRNAADGSYYVYAEYLYDNLGNMTEEKDANGISTSYIWGRDGLGVIIKVENAANTTIKSLSGMSDIFNNPPAGGSIAEKANAIKTGISNAQVSWSEYLKYDTPVKMTDPSGKTILYTYDNNDRLIRVTDSGNGKAADYTYNTITK